MCIGTLAAGLAVRRQRYRAWHSTCLRHTTPWVLQLAGAGLISTNSAVCIWVLVCSGLGGWVGCAVAYGGMTGQQATQAWLIPGASCRQWMWLLPKELVPCLLRPLQELNWTFRVACFAAWLLFLRSRQPQKQAAWKQEEEAASSAQATPAAPAAGTAAAEAVWRGAAGQRAEG